MTTHYEDAVDNIKALNGKRIDEAQVMATAAQAQATLALVDAVRELDPMPQDVADRIAAAIQAEVTQR